MKATELMIGDYVRYKSSKRIIQIESVWDEGVNYDYWQDELDWTEEEKIEPIPLTEEILKANGFINHEDNGWKLFKLWEWSVEIHLHSDGSVIKISREIEGFKGVDECHICYNNNVHQLQHALRLCGLNDLADKFKVE